MQIDQIILDIRPSRYIIGNKSAVHYMSDKNRPNS